MADGADQRLLQGQVVAERFRIEGIIGEGGMGTIYRARHVKLPRTFALKLLKPELAQDADFVARFMREAVAASQVIHPNVVNVTDFGQLPDGSYYIAMEYLEGEGLDRLLDREGPMGLGRALDILIQLADALGYCHDREIVHRDLKTDNIILCTIHGRRDVVKLVDFGIARMLGPDLAQWRITQGGVIFGTPEYLSPERALDAEVDGRSDIYSLGVIAFELVTGEPPFSGKYTQILKAHISEAPPPPSARASQPLPQAFDALVLRCMAKTPQARYQTCEELLGALLRVRGTMAGGADPGAGAPPGAGAGQGSVVVGGAAPWRPSTSGSWRALAVHRSSLPPPSSSLASPPESAALGALGEAVHMSMEAAAIRAALRNTLKELAYGLENAGAQGSALSAQLEQVLRAEQKHKALAQEIADLADQVVEIRLETDEYLASLRQIHLDIETVAAQDDPSASQYAPALDALDGHMMLLQRERDSRSAAIKGERRRMNDSRAELDTELARLYFALYAGVMTQRGTDAATTQPMERLYGRLDQLQARLADTWSQIP